MSSDDWELVETLGSEPEAALIAGFLESCGIPVRVESRFFRQEPVTFGPMAEVRLCVPPEQVAEARSLLAERRARFDVVDGEKGERSEDDADRGDENDDGGEPLREKRS
jgi:hypothetical protein